ncbi:MAG: hypothetical protein ACP5N5_04520 [Desulfurococcus sp.]|uniref:hypothetical protein n=1 Tax=Desulfurococcus sp. TaxID=51678 RepID=UPI003D141DDE
MLFIATLLVAAMIPPRASLINAVSASYNAEYPSIEDPCSFIASFYVDFGDGSGCCVESPVVEPDVCYISSNMLAEHVLRNICGLTDTADKAGFSRDTRSTGVSTWIKTATERSGTRNRL